MNCYLLVGGRSKRMGRQKLDLELAGTTFLHRVLDAARPVFDHVLAVHRSDGEPLPTLETILESPHEGEAPIFGIQRALRHAPGRCFIVAVDYPLITSEVLRELSSRFASAAAPMLVPVWRERTQVLCAGYSPELLPRIDRRIASGHLDLRGLIDEVGAEIIAEEDLRKRHGGEPLMNVNTPEEFEEARRVHGRQE